MTARASGREPDDLRPIAFTRDYTEFATGSVLVEFGRTRVLCTASVEERVPPWLRGTGKGWVTAEYSMLPGSTPGARRPRSGARASSRAARRRSSASSAARCARSPTSTRCARCRSPSTATCCRPTAARAPRRSAAATSRCTTRARRLVASRTMLARTRSLDPCAAISVGIVDGAADARPRLLRRRARRGRHERRDDRRGPLRRGAGHRRGARVHPRRARRAARSSPSTGIAEIFAAQQEMLAEPPRAALMTACRCRSCSRPATPTRRARSSRSSSTQPTSRSSRWAVTVGTHDVRLPARPSGRASRTRSRALRHRSKRPTSKRPATTLEENARLKARGARATRPACPRSPTTPGSRSTRSTARPACTRRATRVRTRPTPTTSTSCSRELEAARPTLRTARFATVALAALARRSRGRGARRGRGRDRDGRPRDGAASATTRCSCPPKGDGRTFAEMSAGREACAVAPGARASAALAEALLRTGGMTRMPARSPSPDVLRRVNAASARAARQRRPSSNAARATMLALLHAERRWRARGRSTRSATSTPTASRCGCTGRRRRRRPAGRRLLPRRRVGDRERRASTTRICRALANAARRDRRVGRLPPRARAPVPGRRSTTAGPRCNGSPNNAAELRGDPSRLAVAGDSAGGNLAAVVRTARPRRRAAAPRSRLLIYPVTDHEFTSSASYARQRRGLLPRSASRCAGSSTATRAAAPTPPTGASRRCARPTSRASRPRSCITAEYDPLRDQGEAYAERLARRGRAGRADALRRA